MDSSSQLPHLLQRKPHLADVHVDVFQGSTDAPMAQKILDDVQVAFGLPHQISGNRMPESVWAHVHPELATERRVETRELIHIHRSAHMSLRKFVHVEQLLGGTESPRIL